MPLFTFCFWWMMASLTLVAFFTLTALVRTLLARRQHRRALRARLARYTEPVHELSWTSVYDPAAQQLCWYGSATYDMGDGRR